MDIIQTIKDAYNVAKKLDNVDLQKQIVDIQSEVNNLQLENIELKQQIASLKREKDIEDQIVRHSSPYITLKNDPQHIPYCSTCWATKHQLVQVFFDGVQRMKCPSCDSEFSTDYKKWLEEEQELELKEEKLSSITNVKEGRKKKAAQGQYSGGKPPFGYDVVGGKLVINPDEAETVRRIFKLKEDGLTLRDIAAQCFREGRTTSKGTKFNQGSIKNILDNRKTYEGYYHYKGLNGGETWVKGEQEPILKEDES